MVFKYNGSHKYYTICGKNQKPLEGYSLQTLPEVFLKPNVILHKRSRACPCLTMN